MEPQNIAILAGLLLAVSVCLNVFLLFRVKRKPPRPQSVELQEFLGEMLRGGALVAVRHIPDNDIMLRSPKR